MSSRFPYIDVAVSMAEGENSATTFLTEGAPAVELPALSGVASHFESLTDGYLIWPAGRKRAFTYFVLDDADHSTLLSVTILVDREVLLSGRPIVNFIKSLRTFLVEGGELSSGGVDEMLHQAGFVEEPLRSDYDAWGNPTSGGVCCREYATPAELTSFLGFPRQSAYSHYRGVLIVPSTATMIPGEELPQITTPVDKALMVVCPAGVTASAEAVNFSDHLKVTYTCEGFDPVQVMFEVGTTNRYVRINGPALIVNPARHAGIIFRRKVPYSVVNQSGIPVETFTILINGRTANRSDKGFEVTNIDFEHGDVTIIVSSTNFSTYTRTFTPESLEKAIPLSIVLEADTMDILLRLDFGEGRVIEERVNIEKNTPEYNQLRAGWFHEFRAHRVMGATPETYNVDVRLTQETHIPAHVAAEPTLPFETIEKTEHTETSTPVREIATSTTTAVDTQETPAYESKTEPKAPVFTNVAAGDNESAKEKQDFDYTRYLTYVKYVVAIIVFCLLVWIASKIVGGCGSDAALTADTIPAADSLTEQTTDSVMGAQAPVAQAPAAVDAEAEKADIEYLNDNKVWRKDRLRSEKYKALFTALESGDIEKIAGHDYFAIRSQAKNSEAVKAITNMWKAKGSPQEKAQRKMVSDRASSGAINIHQLHEDIARRMPKPSEENKKSRPSR